MTTPQHASGLPGVGALRQPTTPPAQRPGDSAQSIITEATPQGQLPLFTDGVPPNGVSKEARPEEPPPPPPTPSRGVVWPAVRAGTRAAYRRLKEMHRAARVRATSVWRRRRSSAFRRHAKAIVTAVARESRAASTRQQQDRCWRRYTEWCQTHGVNPMRADPTVIGVYLITLHDEQGLSVGSVRVHRAAIAAHLSSAGSRHLCDDPVLADVIRGLANRDLGRGQRQARPLTERDFEAIRRTAHRPRRRGRGWEKSGTARRRGDLEIAIISLMRGCLLRCSEAARAHWEHLEVQQDGTGRLRIPYDKTHRDEQILYVSQRVMADLQPIRPEGAPVGPIFSGLGTKSISRHIADAARAAGLGAGFTSHSCRRGMAVDLAERGVALPLLAQAGRWRDPEMVLYYIRALEASRGGVAQYEQLLQQQGTSGPRVSADVKMGESDADPEGHPEFLDSDVRPSSHCTQRPQ